MGSLKDPITAFIPWLRRLLLWRVTARWARAFALCDSEDHHGIQGIFQRVGAGAFVSEIFGEEADELRRRRRWRRIRRYHRDVPEEWAGMTVWLPATDCRIQGTTDVAFTVLDVLGYLDEIPVCVAYDIDGKITTEFPTTSLLEKAKPVLETLPGWKCDIRGIRKYEDLPENCRKYVEFIEEKIGFPITMVSNGPGRNDIIWREK